MTKELGSAKQALEQERKLRSLQMDAIKVLWKEVQMMEAAKKMGVSHDQDNKPVPSGIYGSKISSRSSEHSIAKLMETLEATSKAGMSQRNVEDAIGSENIDRGFSADDSNRDEVVQRLTQTCGSLQNQVEQLQSSLANMMSFMNSISANMELMRQQQQQQIQAKQSRTRHSSSTSTTQDTATSFQFYSGPGSLPPSLCTSVLADNQQQISLMSMDEGIIRDPRELVTLASSRPSTLPGLHDQMQKKGVPGLAHLAGLAVLESPKAPTDVKAFAKTLVDGLLIETISKTVSRAEENEALATDTSLSLAPDENVEEVPAVDNTRPEGKDEENRPEEDESSASHLDTDSLDEHNSPKKKQQT